jgi:hypothetical protein
MRQITVSPLRVTSALISAIVSQSGTDQAAAHVTADPGEQP